MKTKILISTTLLFVAGTFVFAGESPFVRKNLRWDSRLDSVKTEEPKTAEKENTVSLTDESFQKTLSEKEINVIINRELQKRLAEIETDEKTQKTLSEEEINAIINRELQKRLTEIEKENAKAKKETELEKIGPAPAPQQSLSVEQIEKIIDRRIEEKKAEEERNNGWYLSFAAQAAMPNDKIWGSEKMEMFGGTILVGKELDDSIWDIAGMLTVMTGSQDASMWGGGYYYSSKYIDIEQIDLLAGVRVGFALEPVSWLTLKCGVMGGLDLREIDYSYRSWEDYWGFRSESEKKDGLGYFFGAYAGAQINISTHWSLNLEASLLMTDAEVEEAKDCGVESSLGYNAFSAGLTYRW